MEFMYIFMYVCMYGSCVDAFDNPEDPYLPHDILWRQKEQFSDGVGYGEHCNPDLVRDQLLLMHVCMYVCMCGRLDRFFACPGCQPRQRCDVPKCEQPIPREHPPHQGGQHTHIHIHTYIHTY